MKTRFGYHRTCAAYLTTLVLVAGLCNLPCAQAAEDDAAPVAATGEAAVDGGWPRGYQTPLGAQVVLYQPQIARWEQQKTMIAYSAVSYLAQGEKEPVLGTIKIEADTSVALEERLVSFASLRITEANFPALKKEQTSDMVTEITKAIPEKERVIALDRVLANIDKSQITPKNVDGIKADPPVVFYSEKPAVLVVFDGEPIWSPIRENSLRFVVNTNWDVFQEGTDGPLYLRNENAWIKSDKLAGAWTPAGTLPDQFAALPDADWKDVKEALPGESIAAQDIPTVYINNGPAELILTQGAPAYEAVEGTSLQWVSNTESDVFRLGTEGPFYYLVTGRWFASLALTGPWSFVTPDLPEDFMNIPADHPRAHVLASVPGTEAAMEAILLAQVPQTARVKISEVKAPEVVYQEAPKFEPIADTSMQMAVNTDKDIILVGDLYYMCYQGVWFVAASPTGPWEVATSVPGDIYTIPPSSPVYDVTYVTVEDYDDEWVEYACAAGYAGLMTAWGCAVWGTGYYYPPYVWYSSGYPVYYPRPVTYGCGASYNPWTGRYGYAAGAYGPYGGIGAGAVYNPRTGTYARGAVAYGPNSARGAAQAWNPRTDTYAQTRQGSNVYGSWGSTYVQRGDDWAATKRYTSDVTGATTRVVRTDEGAAVMRRGGPAGPQIVTSGDGGNVYAGQDGNVYRQKDNGKWQSWDNEGWKKADVPTPTLTNISEKGDRIPSQQTPANRQQQAPLMTQRPAQPQAGTYRPAQTGYGNQIAQSGFPTGQVNPMASQLNRDAMARQAGAQRTRDYSNYRSAQTAPGMASGNRANVTRNQPNVSRNQANVSRNRAPAAGNRGGGGARGGGGGRGGGGRR